MSRLSGLNKVLLTPLIFILWATGYEKYVGEDRFITYWKDFDKR